MAIITAENHTSSRVVIEPNGESASPVLFGAVFGRKANPPKHSNRRNPFVSTETLQILSAGVLNQREPNEFGQRNPFIGVRHPVGGGGDGGRSKGRGGDKDDNEHRKKCASPECDNMVMGGNTHCAACRAQAAKRRAAATTQITQNGVQVIPKDRRHH